MSDHEQEDTPEVEQPEPKPYTPPPPFWSTSWQRAGDEAWAEYGKRKED